MAGTGERQKSVDFAVAQLKANPNATMSDIKKAAKGKGVKIYPLIIGYAYRTLGIKKPARKPAGTRGRGPGRPPGKRGPGRPPGNRGPGRPPGARGPGRPPKRGPGRPRGRGAAPGDPAAALGNIVTHMRDLEREVSALRAALDKIGEIASGR